MRVQGLQVTDRRPGRRRSRATLAATTLLACAALAATGGSGAASAAPSAAATTTTTGTTTRTTTRTTTAPVAPRGADDPQPAAAVAAALSGRLMFDDGRPSRETKVELVSVGREDSLAWSFTDLHGRWTLAAAVPADGYQLRFVLGDGDWFWYPGTKDRDEADVLTIASGAGTSDLDVTWPPPARVRITVTDPTGRPLPGICLDRTRVPRCTKSSGVVTLPDVDSGSLTISGWSRSARWFLPATTLQLQRGEQAETTLVAAPAATLRGRLLDASGEPLVRACPEVFVGDAVATGVEHLRTRCSDGEGRWQVTGLPEGRFRVRLALSTSTGLALVWWPMAAASNGARTLVATAGEVTDDGSTSLPEFGSLAGRVVDVDGNPVADAWVQIGTPDLTDPRGETSDHSATTSSDGHFRIDGVPAWTAPVMVTAPGGRYGATWSGGVSSADLAEPVTIGWGRTTRVTLTLLPQAPLTVTLAGALVAGDAYRVEAVDAQGNVVGFGVTLSSDQPTGVVRGLAAGSVRLRVVHLPAGPDDTSASDHPRYYPDAGHPSAADVVDLPADGASLTWELPADL